MKFAIVTGSAGFIGRNLVKFLMQNGYFVYALQLENTKSFFDDKKIKNIHCNLENISLLNEYIDNKKIDVFYHLAWNGTSGDDRSDYVKQLTNVKHSCDCMIMAKKMNCRRFIGVGTITENIVNNNFMLSQNMMYGLCKKQTFEILSILSIKLNINFIWAQLSNIYGIDNTSGNILSYAIKQLNDNQVASFSNGNHIYDFLYLDDVINALHLLGVCNNKVTKYFVGSGSPMLLKEYLLKIGTIANKENLIGLGNREDDKLVYLESWFDIDDLIRDTGFMVENTFEENIKKIIEIEE